MFNVRTTIETFAANGDDVRLTIMEDDTSITHKQILLTINGPDGACSAVVDIEELIRHLGFVMNDHYNFECIRTSSNDSWKEVQHAS